jgi:cell division protein FtsB
MQNNRVWTFLKYLSFVMIALMAVVLLSQYINLAILNNKNENLRKDLQAITTELANKEDSLEHISSEEFLEDQAKENLGMKEEGEEIIIGN